MLEEKIEPIKLVQHQATKCSNASITLCPTLLDDVGREDWTNQTRPTSSNKVFKRNHYVVSNTVGWCWKRRLNQSNSIYIYHFIFLLYVFNHFRLSTPPETLDQLGESLALLEQLQQDLPNIEAKFTPLHEQFAILEKYEVAIPEEVTN